MTTVLAVYNSEGCVGRCDANCHDATDDKCTCICGGKNHGVGLQKAIEHNHEMIGLTPEDLKKFAEAHGYDLNDLKVYDANKTSAAKIRRERKAEKRRHAFEERMKLYAAQDPIDIEAVMEKTAERQAYEFLKAYHNDDQGIVDGWRSHNDPRWTLTVKLCASYAAEIARLQEAKRGALTIADVRSKENASLLAEIARLRARPTEEEVARAIAGAMGVTLASFEVELFAAARAVLALYPKVQP